jgi:6-pyruvoyltetrahydropterin/6-carboxytetrahydropterin synthase
VEAVNADAQVSGDSLMSHFVAQLEQASDSSTATTGDLPNTMECELSQRFYFEAAHTLHRTVDAAGSLRIHGHTYEAIVSVRGKPSAADGMVLDLGYLRSEIARVRNMLDHQFLDEVKDLGPATLENLCFFIRAQLTSAVPGLCSVTVERRASGDSCALRW